MGAGESLDGVAIVGVAALHLNKRAGKPLRFPSQHFGTQRERLVTGWRNMIARSRFDVCQGCEADLASLGKWPTWTLEPTGPRYPCTVPATKKIKSEEKTAAISPGFEHSHTTKQ